MRLINHSGAVQAYRSSIKGLDLLEIGFLELGSHGKNEKIVLLMRLINHSGAVQAYRSSIKGLDLLEIEFLGL